VFGNKDQSLSYTVDVGRLDKKKQVVFVNMMPMTSIKSTENG
jgi:hypothetical protein